MADTIQKKKTNAKRRAKRRAQKIVASLLVLVILGVAGYFLKDSITASKADPVSGNEVQFHFIDVGQGDAALIRTTAGDVLIDTGDNGTEDDLKAYLDKYRVDDLEYVIFTHPDSDHIGGGDVILQNYDVKRVIRPDYDADTQIYERLEGYIKDEKAEDIRAKVGETFMVGEVKFTVLAPLDSYAKDDRNNHSVVLRVDYGETSILYTGDAELKSENDMLDQYGSQAGGMLDCDILKVGHHGSDTSSGKNFIRAVTPDHAIISCGENNKHGHPDQVIVDRYEDLKVPILRTDKLGSIVFRSYGEEPEQMAA